MHLTQLDLLFKVHLYGPTSLSLFFSKKPKGKFEYRCRKNYIIVTAKPLCETV